MAVGVLGTVEDRYDRDWLNHDRKQRTMDHQSTERRERLYVDPATGDTVTAVGDARPDQDPVLDEVVFDPNEG
jgi:hypothetical protein